MYFLDLKYPSSSSFKHYFDIVEFYGLYVFDHRSFILKLFLGCDCKFSVGCIQTGHAYFFSRRFVEGCGKGAGFCDITCCHQYIDCIQGSSSSSSSVHLCQ